MVGTETPASGDDSPAPRGERAIPPATARAVAPMRSLIVRAEPPTLRIQKPDSVSCGGLRAPLPTCRRPQDAQKLMPLTLATAPLPQRAHRSPLSSSRTSAPTRTMPECFACGYYHYWYSPPASSGAWQPSTRRSAVVFFALVLTGRIPRITRPILTMTRRIPRITRPILTMTRRILRVARAILIVTGRSGPVGTFHIGIECTTAVGRSRIRDAICPSLNGRGIFQSGRCRRYTRRSAGGRRCVVRLNDSRPRRRRRGGRDLWRQALDDRCNDRRIVASHGGRSNSADGGDGHGTKEHLCEKPGRENAEKSSTTSAPGTGHNGGAVGVLLQSAGRAKAGAADSDSRTCAAEDAMLAG